MLTSEQPTKIVLTKDDVLALHREIYVLRHLLETHGFTTPSVFDEYDKLNVDPLRIDQPKTAHVTALRTLTRCLQNAVRATPKPPNDWGRL